MNDSLNFKTNYVIRIFFLKNTTQSLIMTPTSHDHVMFHHMFVPKMQRNIAKHSTNISLILDHPLQNIIIVDII